MVCGGYRAVDWPVFEGVRGGVEMAPQTDPEIPPVKTTCYKTVKKLCMGVLTCLGMGPYKPLHRTRAAALLATVTFALDFFELAAMLIGPGLKGLGRGISTGLTGLLFDN